MTAGGVSYDASLRFLRQPGAKWWPVKVESFYSPFVSFLNVYLIVKGFRIDRGELCLCYDVLIKKMICID